ncbi:MAG: adenylate/guanylate cyclase domain-containing protein [Acidimicrobiia bacterium]|nr:adenylate/guanylate cyclase domain-containing protein [Acidimicrobiia bacterium]
MKDVKYADAGGHHIAYQTMGDGSGVDVVMVAGTFFSFEMLAEDRVASRFMAGLEAFGRLVVFDKRGVGLSDPMTDWSTSAQEQWAEDLCAVIQAAELLRPAVVSWEPLGVARLAASMQPELFGSLVLINPARFTKGLADLIGSHGDEGVSGRSVEEIVFPSRNDDADFRDWLSRAGRSGASPAMAARMWDHVLAYSDPLTPEGIDVRTLVLHNRDAVALEPVVHEVAAEIPGAGFVEVPGSDLYPIAGDVDALVAEIAQFVTGAPTMLAPQRLVTAVLFTDLVASTERAVESGDEQWQSLLDLHDRAVARSVLNRGGRVVKFTGDGVLALLPSVTAAIEAAQSIREALIDKDMDIRAGIHVGDVDVRGDDVSGISVNVAARIMGHANAGETLVSDAACQATLGSGFSFDSVGDVQLKGLPGQFTLHRMAPAG